MRNIGSPYRPIAMKMRDDLKVVTHINRGEPNYVVGDMLAFEFFRLNEQEYFLLKSLDGNRSVQSIKEEFEIEFAPYQIRHDEIQAYLIDFHKKSLVASQAPDQGRHLHRLGRKRLINKKLSSLKSLLAIRFRGINPDRIFQILTPLIGWFFTKWAIAASAVMMLAAMLLLASNFDEFARRLPNMQQFFASSNWLSLACVLIGLKIVHEFGHGIVFTKFGGRCHELGIMLLVFMPTLFVNTSDSWRLSNKWQRAAIAAAGVYVELCCATFATFVWWHSEPGAVHYAALNVMFLGSVSAVFFNGNPLLKFDAYYLLSDLAEIPNLQGRSTQFIRNAFLNRGLGVREGDDHLLPAHTKRWLACYAIAAFLYRLVIVYFIAFVIVRIFRPAGLESVAKMFSLFCVFMIFAVPVMAIVNYLRTPGKFAQIHTARVRTTGVIVAVLMLLFFAMPLPDAVVCDFMIRPKSSQTVYVRHDAVLKTIHVQPRQTVNKGDKIATLRNLDVDLEITTLEGELTEIDNGLRMTRLARYQSTRGSGNSRTLREQRVTKTHRLAELKKIQNEMVLVAPRDGVVLPQWQHALPREDTDAIESWHGWTLHNENLSTTFFRGQPICKIGDLANTEARLIIDQSDIKLVREGQPVELMLDSHAGENMHTTVGRISLVDADLVASHVALQYGGGIETKQSKGAQIREISDPESIRPLGAVYEATARIPTTQRALQDGIRGTARITIGKRTAFGKLYRFLQKTFRLDL